MVDKISGLKELWFNARGASGIGVDPAAPVVDEVSRPANKHRAAGPPSKRRKTTFLTTTGDIGS